MQFRNFLIGWTVIQLNWEKIQTWHIQLLNRQKRKLTKGFSDNVEMSIIGSLNKQNPIDIQTY